MVLLTRTGASSGSSSSVALAFIVGAFKAGATEGVGFNERPDPHVTHCRTLT
jgi:hypothetical protein